MEGKTKGGGGGGGFFFFLWDFGFNMIRKHIKVEPASDFCSLELNSYVQMDTVKSSRDSQKTLLTMIFTEEKLFLAFLINRCTKGAVRAVFDRLEKRMGTYEFTSVFENILTDRGSEFGNPEELETGITGIQRSSIYYCDPMRSGQKGTIEQAHTMLRMILPKGTSFEFLTQ